MGAVSGLRFVIFASLLFLFLGFVFFSPTCWAKYTYPSDRLKIIDVKTLERIINEKLQYAEKALYEKQYGDIENDFSESSNEQESYSKSRGHYKIKTSLEILFARPKQDQNTSALFSNIQNLVVDYGGIYSFCEAITRKALSVLTEDSSNSSVVRDQNTALYILHNMMQEIKPKAKSPDGRKYRDLIRKIRDSDIEFSDALKSYRLLNSMSPVLNPSKEARTIVGRKPCGWWEFWC